MEATLVPLALLGLCGGVLNLPDYLGGGWLGGFLGPEAATVPPEMEFSLQMVAGILALAGIAVAHNRYGGDRRAQRLAAAEEGAHGVTAFLLQGWRFDDLYGFLFVRPFKWLAPILWQRVDEGVIDDSLDRLARLVGRGGEGVGSWTTGRVSVYLASLAAGGALVLIAMVWMVV